MPTAAPHFDPAQAFTCRATGAAVIGARFVRPTGAKVNGGNIPVAHATATSETIGVTQRDKAQDKAIAVYGSGFILNATAGAAIAAGAGVQLAADGKVITYTSGRKVGVAIEAAAGDGVVFLIQVQL